MQRSAARRPAEPGREKQPAPKRAGKRATPPAAEAAPAPTPKPAAKAALAKTAAPKSSASKAATSKSAASKSAVAKAVASKPSAPKAFAAAQTAPKRAAASKPAAAKTAAAKPAPAPKAAKPAPRKAAAAPAKKQPLSNGAANGHANGAAPAPKPHARLAEPAPAPRPAPERPRSPEPERSAATTSAEAGPAGDQQAPANPFASPEVETFANNMARLWEAGATAMAAMVRPREQGGKPSDNHELMDVARTLGHVVERWAQNPDRVAQTQRDFAAGFLDMWSGALRRFSGETVEPVVRADPKDARFKDPEWTDHPLFDFIKQAYLHASRFADRIVDDVEDLDPHLRHKASFYVKLLANAASPSNFVPTNPELIRETLASKGENLIRGMKMLAEDIEAGNGSLRIRQTDTSGFEVGRNLATTPGKVVFRNELFELIQYAPTTEMVRTRPVVIVPPWINKFYVLDLTPEKSLIAWAVSQGLTVFCVSWVNPDARHAALSFDDYMTSGIMQAVDVAREISGSEQVDTVGYCVGGTLLSVTLAYMAAQNDRRIASATLLTTQVDFTHAGDLMVFVDEEQIAAVEAKMAEAGYLEGASMANAFNMIRANDMIFPYLVNNYLKGKAPFPFDLLYWNSDATRMPAANHSFYLRGCYLNNDLARGRMEVKGEKLDLDKVRTPIYQLATKEDHIAPATSVFLGAQLFGGPVRFVLAGSGHIAGVVNPPAKMKYQHWVGGDARGELAHWLDHAEEKPGSWWPDWRAWLAGMDATMVDARTPGEGKYAALDDAPGTYVKVRS